MPCFPFYPQQADNQENYPTLLGCWQGQLIDVHEALVLQSFENLVTFV